MTRRAEPFRGFLDGAMHGAIVSGDFERLRSNAPSVPDETCPMIDAASVLASAISGDLGVMREGLQESRRKTAPKADIVAELLDHEANLAALRLRLEEIRTANDQLRRSSYYWRQAALRLARKGEA